jgi:hypothetical protein
VSRVPSRLYGPLRGPRASRRQMKITHRRQAGILQARGERVRVVVGVRQFEQIPSSWEPDIEAERPWAVDPRSGEQRFGVVEKCPQSNLIRIAGLIP